jgi:hypothetical protein
VARDVLDAHSIFYCKEDGSIDCGFEIVTHPFSMSWFRGHQGISAFKRLQSIPEIDGYHLGTCGQHVHVSRNTFEPHEIYNLQLLFEINSDVIYTLSRRTPRSFNEWSGINRSTHETKLQLAQHPGGPRGALNLSNSHTMEIRIFRSSTRFPVIAANLEACELLCNAAQQLTRDEIQRGHETLLPYFLNNAQEYPYFHHIHGPMIAALERSTS